MKINEVINEGIMSSIGQGLMKGLGFVSGMFDPELEKKLSQAQIAMDNIADKNTPRLVLPDRSSILKKSGKWVDINNNPVTDNPQEIQALDNLYNNLMKNMNLGNTRKLPQTYTKDTSKIIQTLPPHQQAIEYNKAQQDIAQQAAMSQTTHAAAPAVTAAPTQVTRPLAQKLKQQRVPAPRGVTR